MEHWTIVMLLAGFFGAGLDAGPRVVPPGSAAPEAAPAVVSAAAPSAAPVVEPDRGPHPRAPASADPEDEEPGEAPEEARLAPRLLTDILVVGGMTAAHSLAYGPVREPLFGEASPGRVLRNFANPIGRAVEGWAEDDDPFSTNFVAHPLSWGMMGLYLKERGYSSGSALLLTQLHSIAWEYVVEGLYQKPSGLDLVTNLGSASAAIYVLHGIAERAAEREAKGPHHRILTVLNPLRPLRGVFRPGPGDELQVTLSPVAGGVALALTLDR